MRLVSRKFWLLVSMSLLVPAGASVSRGANQYLGETKLAGLRPGKDTPKTFQRKIRWESHALDRSSDHSYDEQCNCQTVDVYPDRSVLPTKVSVSEVGEPTIADCVAGAYLRHSRTWLGSGRRLHIGVTRDDAVKIYGKPESETSGTESKSVIKSMTYDYRWAGPKVPQMLQIESGTPDGKVIKMTLSASKP